MHLKVRTCDAIMKVIFLFAFCCLVTYEVKASKKNKLQRDGLAFQPLVIVVGPSLTDIHTSCIYKN